MWFGTQDGLNKYDGYSFKVYRPDPENPNSVSHNIILALREDHRGLIWIGTMGGGLNQFNRETETFTHYRNRPEDGASLGSNFVQAIHEDRSRVLWVGTTAGLNKFHRETGTFTRYLDIPGDSNSLSDNVVNAIYEDRANVLWIGTNNGLNKFNPETGTFDRYREEPGKPHTLSSNVITSIREDHSGEFWMGTVNGLNRFDRETGKFTVYRYQSDNPHSLSSNAVNRVYEDHAGVLWVTTVNRGINTFDRRTERFVHYGFDANNPTSLSSDFISSIYEDRSGILWIGTAGAGLDQFDRETEKFKHYNNDPNNPNSLSMNFVYGFCEDRSGNLWITTNGGGLNRFDPGTGQFTHYRADPGNSDSLNSDLVFCVYEDSTGVLWVGLNGAGVDRFEPGTGTFRHYTQRTGDPSALSNNFVRVIYEDSGAVPWFGTQGGGLNRFNRQTGTFNVYRFQPDNSHSISDDNIRAIHEDREEGHVLWVGTTNGGLNKFDRETGRFTRYRSTINDPTTLGSDNIQSIYQDPSGILWLGTFGGGLNKFDPRKGTVVNHYREKNGLPNDVVYGILPDEQGFLWLSTNKGLSRFNPRSETFKNYTSRDGLQSNEFNGGAYYKNKSGEMFFGGLNGFNAFYPRDFKDNKHIPPIVITDFQIFNKSVGIGCDSPLKKHISGAGEIILSYEENVFSFKFVALDYTIPEKNQYRYMMEGFDKEWTLTDASKRFATYTNLDPGEYVFRVRGSNNDGVWNEEGTSIKIIITPPFWQTWWFRVISVLVVVVLALLYYRVRMRIIYQKTRLEAELQAARVAQMSIMPQSDPQLEGFYISGTCVPAHEVGGDFFDYLWLDPAKTKFGIAIGDVSGKAMKAAMTAVMSSGMLYTKVDCAGSIKDIMTELNRPLFTKTDRKMFTALCLAALDLGTKEFVFTNAGLSEPLLKSQDSIAYIESVGPRLPLGSFKDNTYQETKLQLKPFDVLVMFTDGIPETQNHRGEFYGYDTLRLLVEKMDTTSLSAVEIKEAIITDVNRFSGGVPQQDDMTVVVIKYQ
jgi:serine phosphatase RsbU (regulator of sigma subunit)/ligand-binding sensor domain-containing protein